MAEKMKDWQSTIVWGIVLIFFGGMAYKTLEIVDAKTITNAQSNSETNKKVDKLVESLHKEEVARMKMQGEITSTNKTVGKIEVNQEKLMDYLMQYDFDKKDK